MIYEIAGLRVLLQHKHPYTEKFCARYLSSDQENEVDIVASATEEDIAEERAQSPNFSEGYIENICLYRSLCLQIPQRNRLLLHASVLDFNGKGYAFLGRSGTGKSTHTKLWLQNVQNTFVVNGDKPILQETAPHFIAYGTPWQGKEGWGAKTETALCGLCFLEQAKVRHAQADVFSLFLHHTAQYSVHLLLLRELLHQEAYISPQFKTSL